MTTVLADTCYFLALLNAHDELNREAAEYTSTLQGKIITTAWVLTEVVDALSSPE